MAVIELSRIRIELVSNPQDGDFLFFRDTLEGTTYNILFKNNVNSGEVNSFGSILIDIKNTIAATKKTLLDFGINRGNSNLHRYIDVSNNTIDIIALNPNSEWQTLPPNDGVNLTVDKGYFEEKLSVISLTPVVSNTCSNTVDIRVITTSDVEEYGVDTGVGVVADTPNSSDFVISVPRDLSLNLKLIKNYSVNDEVIETPISAIRYVEVNPSVDYSGNNSTVTIKYNFGEDVNNYGAVINMALFSIDGVNYQQSNKFQNQPDGILTCYVKDSFGCVKTEDIIIDILEGTRIEGDVSFSLSNSFHWACREDINFCNKYPSLENTLSYEERTLNNQGFRHLVQNCDVIINQFRSDLSNHKAYIHSCGNKQVIPVFKKTQNLNNTVFLTAYVEKANDADLTILSFADKTIPSYFTVGSSILFSDGSFTITSFFKDSTKGIDYIVTDRPFEGDFGVVTQIPIHYTYSDSTSEVYEIVVDMKLLSGVYWLEMEAPYGNSTKSWVSEMFEVQDRQEKTYEIISSSTTNTDINYSTGIKHLFRLKYEREKIYIGEDKIEILDTDTSIAHLDATVRDAWEFRFNYLPTSMMPKLRRIFSLDQLYIDRVGYIKLGSVETEIIGETNLYRLILKVYNSGSYFSTNRATEQTDNNQTGFIEINTSGIGFINSGSGGSPIGNSSS